MPELPPVAVLGDDAPEAPTPAVHDDLDLGVERAALPLGRLGAMVGSGAFAVWTSLTCFVC